MSTITKKLTAVFTAALGLTFAAQAEVVTNQYIEAGGVQHADWGYTITGLGAGGDEVACVFTKTGSTLAWTVPDGVVSARLLIVGGGGSGGSTWNQMGGGGAGAMREEDEVPLTAGGTVNVTVGAGAAGVTGNVTGKKGSQSSFGTYWAEGGGAGGSSNGGNGGSGGGGGTTGAAGSANNSLYGHNGGKPCSSAKYTGGGGGGAGTAGSTGGKNTGGNGGAGMMSDITGEEIYYAGGGGGGTYTAGNSTYCAPGGIGGGGTGGNNNGGIVATAGVDGLGGGGGGGDYTHTSGRGGNGVVIVRYAVISGEPIDAPTIDSVTYDGEPHTPVVAASDDYSVTTLPEDVVEAGEYDVVLEPASGKYWSDTGSFDPRTIKFIINKAANSWSTEPSLSKMEWVFDESAAEVTIGAAFGEVVVTYDDDLQEMPVSIGDHVAHFTVTPDGNHGPLAMDVNYSVKKMTGGWATEPKLTKTSWRVGDDPASIDDFLADYGCGDAEIVYDGSLGEMPTTVGKHHVTITIPENGSYYALVRELEYVIYESDDCGFAKVTLDGYDGTETLTNFPVLVRFSAENFPGLSAGLLSEDGSDILVTDLEGNELAFEIEAWDPFGESLIWVKIPALVPKTTAETAFFVKWGNTPARTTQTSDVWTAYLAVFHMNDKATLGEAAGYTNTFTGATRTLVDARVGKGVSHDAAMTMTDFVHCVDGLGENYAVSCWYKFPNGGQVNPLSKGTWASNGRWYLEHKESQTTLKFIRDMASRGTLTVNNTTTSWNYVTVVNNNGAMYAAVNNNSSLASYGALSAADNYNLKIGNSGQIDEVRIKKSVSSAAWTRADYRAQTGALVSYELAWNPVSAELVVSPSTETEPSVDNNLKLTIPYRVVSTGGGTASVVALYALKGDSVTNEVTIGSSSVDQVEDDEGYIEDLLPGTNYVCAIYGVNTLCAVTATNEWKNVTTPGPAKNFTASFAHDLEKFVISGSLVPGLGTTTVKVYYKLNGADDYTEETMTLDNGAFSLDVPFESLEDSISWYATVSNDYHSATWGDFYWEDATAKVTNDCNDHSAVTYTWTGNGGDNLWTNRANWSANRSVCWGYPDSYYATAKFTKSATVDLDGGDFKLTPDGLTFSSNITQDRFVDGTIRFNDTGKDGSYGASGTRVVFDNVTVTGRRGLAFVSGATVEFTNGGKFTGTYRPWGATNSRMVISDTELTSSWAASWIEASRDHYIDVTNAVWTVNKLPNTFSWGTTLIDGEDRQARVISQAEIVLNRVWNITIPAAGHSQASIQATKIADDDTSGCTFVLDVTDYERGRKVPLVHFTGADQTAKYEGKTFHVQAKANGVDVTAGRNAKLVWENNTLYYKQTGKFGVMIYVK